MMKKAEIAFKHYEKGEKYEALLVFKELVRDYPKSEHYGRNLYNIPTIYQELDSTALAIEWFKKVLNDRKLDDSEKDHSRGIFETNTNFKHYSAMNIGVINYNTGDYSEALRYYKLADTQYPYYNTSGTDLKLNKIKLASNISDCYLKLNKIDSAIIILLPHALTESPGAKNHASEKIIHIVSEKKRESSFKSELEKSLKSFKKIQTGIVLTCYGIEVKIYPYFDEELTKEYLMNTELYKKIIKAGNNG